MDEEILKELVKGFRKLIILHLLKEGPKHGYEMNKRFEELFNISYPSSVFYPLLREMEKRRLISSTWEKEGERKKRVYSITPDGERILHRQKEMMEGPARRILKDIMGES